MPHVDEMLGAVTVAAAGLAVAVALNPLPSGTVGGPGHPAAPRVAVSVDSPTAPVRLPPVDVVARRNGTPAPASRQAETRASKPVA